MPLYEFKCPNGHITEDLVASGTKEMRCPICRKTAIKIMSLCSFSLKGGGWYKDGYGNNRAPKKEKEKAKK